MFEHVPPAPREMSADARNVLLHHDRSHHALLVALCAVALIIGVPLMLDAVPDLWIGLFPATTEGVSEQVVSHDDSWTIPYVFSVDGEAYRGEVDSADRARFGQLGAGQALVVEYCSLWPRQSRLRGTSAGRRFSLAVAGLVLAVLSPLAVILHRKRRRIALRERTYRDGTPTEGRAIELARRRLRHAHWAELRYSYCDPRDDDAEQLHGVVTAPSREDLEHLDRDGITVLVLPDDPQQSILYWDE